MPPWKQSLRDGALAGSIASVLSAAALLAFGLRQSGRPAAPVNAISHWVWGDAALARDRPSLRHTALGYCIHHAASLFWSTLHVRAFGAAAGSEPRLALTRAALTSAAACFVDYRLTPRRFTPGFEHRLQTRQLAVVYAVFGLGLAAGSVLHARRSFNPPPRPCRGTAPGRR